MIELPRLQKLAEATEPRKKLDPKRFDKFEYQVAFDEKAEHNQNNAYVSRNPYVVYQGNFELGQYSEYKRYPTKKEADDAADSANKALRQKKQ